MNTTKFMIEFNLKTDYDLQLIQSKWFDSKDEAMAWFRTLDWVDTDQLVVWLMYSEFDENGDYTDINFEEDLTERARKGEE